MRYRLSEIASLCEGRLVGFDAAVSEVLTDSRTEDRVEAGSLFVAMRGAHHDSHEFVARMAERGVRAFLLERAVPLPDGCSAVIVSSALGALQTLAADWRGHFRGRMVAIAGSAGKTVVKEWAYRAIEPFAAVFRSPGSYNSQLGVALSLLRLHGDEAVALVEAGISERGEMERLRRMIRPEIVVYTSIGAAHQSGFETLEEKAREKLILAVDAATVVFHSHFSLLASLLGDRGLDAAQYPLPVRLGEALSSETGRIDAQLTGTLMRVLGLPDPDFSQFEPLSPRSHTTVLEVSLGQMRRNLEAYRSLLQPGVGVVAMVKAGSYGAGDVRVARLLESQGVDYFAVAFADEGVTLRRAGIATPIVVLNADEQSFDRMVGDRLEPEIYSFRSLAAFMAAAAFQCDYPIHIKFDTGMHRLGFSLSDIPRLAALLNATKTVRVATIFTHLSRADMPSEDSFTRAQLSEFDRAFDALSAALGYRPLKHAAATSAIERFAEAQYDMVRLGLGLYGFSNRTAVRPVSTLRTEIVQIKRLPAGASVGYGTEGKLLRDSVIATIPVGYADGLDRHAGQGRWAVRVAGLPAPIVGRVCMDSCMVDITDIANIEEGDTAVIFSAAEGNTAADLAERLGTIPYEILTSVSTRVKRVYTDE